jgi:hypothetical protein
MKTNEQFIADLISNLSQEISHKWRVQSFSKNKSSATVVAYIDARDGIDLLNKYAVYGWEREHYMVGNNTYCKVGIFMPDGSVQYRSDVGVESNTDGVKGEASDSFKRACVNWGIGGFLYDLGIEYVNANEPKTSSNYPYCIDEQGKRIWDLTKYMQDKRKGIKSSPAQPITPAKPVTPPATPKAPTVDDRASKAVAKLKAITKLNDVAFLIKAQKDFKATAEGKLLVSGASIEDVVRLNDIDLVLSFYKFVNSIK